MTPTYTTVQISEDPGRRRKRKGKLHISQELMFTKVNGTKQFCAPADNPPTTGGGILQEKDNTPTCSSFSFSIHLTHFQSLS